jgi:hypothetical protein
MPSTGKIRPEVSSRGLLLPWPLVFSLVLTVLVPGLVSFVVFAVKAAAVAEVVQEVKHNDRRQDTEIVEIKTDVAHLKGKQ